MSKGGARRAREIAEVEERIAETEAEKKLLEDTIAEQQAELERQNRINAIFMRCRHKVLNDAGGLYSLPGEVIGAEIAEALMRAAYQQMLNRAIAQRRQTGDDPVRPGDIRLASPLIVPR